MDIRCEINDYLRNKLSIQIDETFIPYEQGRRIKIRLMLGEDIISEDYVDVETD